MQPHCDSSQDGGTIRGGEEGGVAICSIPSIKWLDNRIASATDFQLQSPCSDLNLITILLFFSFFSFHPLFEGKIFLKNSSLKCLILVYLIVMSSERNMLFQVF